jgi:hypothetical protein
MSWLVEVWWRFKLESLRIKEGKFRDDKSAVRESNMSMKFVIWSEGDKL